MEGLCERTVVAELHHYHHRRERADRSGPRPHTRRPPPGDFNRWLDRDSDPARSPIDLLRQFPADEMEAFEVSTDVGNVKNNSPELLNS